MTILFYCIQIVPAGKWWCHDNAYKMCGPHAIAVLTYVSLSYTSTNMFYLFVIVYNSYLQVNDDGVAMPASICVPHAVGV